MPVFLLQRSSLVACPRSSGTASMPRCRSTKNPRSVQAQGAGAPPLCPYPRTMASAVAAGRTWRRASADRTAPGAPAPPSATWMTSQPCQTCSTCPWPPRRPASTAAWSCWAEEGPAPATPPIRRLLLPLPRPCPIRTPRSKLCWMGPTAAVSSCCTHTQHIHCWLTHRRCWTICQTIAQ